jgi:hypothetical protein
MWLPHFTSGHGLYKEVKIAMMPWNQLEVFVEGDKNNPNFPCKFTKTKDHIRLSALGMLTHPRVNSTTLVYRCRL